MAASPRRSGFDECNWINGRAILVPRRLPSRIDRRLPIGSTNSRCWLRLSAGARAAQSWRPRGRKRCSAWARSAPRFCSSARHRASTRTARASRLSAPRGRCSTASSWVAVCAAKTFTFAISSAAGRRAIVNRSRTRRPTVENTWSRTIELVGPKIICCWGAVAAQNLLQTSTGITRLRGKFYNFRDIPVICTFHPAALLEGRSPEKKKDVWEDMKMLLTKLGKPIPAPGGRERPPRLCGPTWACQ